MSYDIELIDKETMLPVTVDNHSEGGTYVIGGINKAELNITYNYAEFYYKHLDKEKGIRWLYGKNGRETAQNLLDTIMILGTKRSSNYWDVTPGNAGYALSILLDWAIKNPEAIFQGD